jgi:tetratricopeptide (TPR) repeat protein
MKQAVELDSTNLGYSANFLGYYCVFSDRNEEAYNLAIRVLEMYKKAGALNLQRSHRVGYAFWQVGKKKEALDYFRQQIKYGEESIKLSRPPDQMKATHYDLAGTYAFLGDKAKAYQHLDEFAKKNTFPLWWVTMIKYDLIFDNIRNEERFQKILQTIESKYLAEQERVRKWLEEQEML